MVFLLYMYAALLRDRSRSAADTTVVASKCLSNIHSYTSKCSSAELVYVLFHFELLDLALVEMELNKRLTFYVFIT